MATSSDLPDDIKYLICAELQGEQSLRALWQVSRGWRAAAEPFLYRGLTWVVDSKDELRNDSRRLAEDDIAKKYLKHARCLDIVTITRENPSAGLRAFNSLTNPVTEPLMEEYIPEILDSTPNDTDKEARDKWKPLISMLALFQRLTDIILHVPTRLPPGIMAAIEQYHPKCRLHMRYFRFNSLHDERALVTSRKLHSMHLHYEGYDPESINDYNSSAVLRTVAQSPNLKHVQMLGWAPCHHSMIPVGKGVIPEIEGHPAVKPQLETLRFNSPNNRLDMEMMEKWKEAADFSKLKDLKCSVSTPVILQHMTFCKTFPSLETLELILESGLETLDSPFRTALEHLVTALNPLSSLTIVGRMHRTLLEVIALRHGSSLKILHIMPLWFDDVVWLEGQVRESFRPTISTMEVLAACCPKLTSLALILHRSMGDRTEVRCFQVLGKIQTLQKLQLSLDCSHPDLDLYPNDDWNEFEKIITTPEGVSPKIYYGDYKRALINSAVDEKLVRQIWDVIHEKRTSKHPLQTLEISAYGGHWLGDHRRSDLNIICHNISRSYKLTAAADLEHGVDVVEVSKQDREWRDEQLRPTERPMGWSRKTSPGYIVFKYIWPYTDDEAWRDVWKSWPLDRSQGDGVHP